MDTTSVRASTHLGRLVSQLELLEVERRVADARRLRLIAEAVELVMAQQDGIETRRSDALEIAHRSLRAELATAFRLSEHQTEGLMDLAHRLQFGYPDTLAALEQGGIAVEHARVVVDAGLVIGVGGAPEVDARRAAYEQDALQVAHQETPNRLRPIARRLAERHAERSLEERHCEAAARRRVLVVHAEDGMADLIAHLPALEAHAIYDRMTRIAKAAERGERIVPQSHGDAGDPDEPDGGTGAGDTRSPRAHDVRTRDELRTDVLAELLLSGDEHTLLAGSTAEALRARVQVIVPVETIRPCTESSPESSPELNAEAGAAADIESGAGAGTQCELVGHGPIATSTARAVAAFATDWHRVRTDAGTGEVLGVDRYRPSEEMRAMLAARDRRCRFPGCRVPISRCDLDHTIDAALGEPTTNTNLAHLCRGHHVLKHHGDWKVAQEEHGVLRWTSPTGRQYLDRPPDLQARPRNRSKDAGRWSIPSTVRFVREREPGALLQTVIRAAADRDIESGSKAGGLVSRVPQQVAG